MRALTLHEPYATLMALGLKGIETRSWRTYYRGRLLIHAGMHKPPTSATIGDVHVGRCEDSWCPLGQRCRALWTGDPNPTGRYAAGQLHHFTLGAIVASGFLVDVVPMADFERQLTAPAGACLIVNEPHDGDLEHQRGGLWLIGPNALTHGHPTRVERERPYGDYRPGRFAWLFTDMQPTTTRCPRCWGNGEVKIDTPTPSGKTVPIPERCPICAGVGTCDPVPATGHQQLWKWDPQELDQ